MDSLTELVGESPEIASLRRTVGSLLQRQVTMRRLPPILIQGETGSGKGLLARLIHRAGPRATHPFVDVNCAAIPEALLEAELFGYERGAFTDARQAKPGLFQTADGGTLFLDEIALLPRALQAKLLTVLDQGVVRRLGATRPETVNVSIITATNEHLPAAIRAGRFREDLYHRLAVITLEMPPLRTRASDIERLADTFLARACAEYGLPSKTLTDDARAALRVYTWPGNVRELNNVLERVALLSESATITAAMLGLPDDVRERARLPEPEEIAPRRMSRERLEHALASTGWNITRTASALGITRNTVRAHIERYGLKPAGGTPRSSRSPTGGTPRVAERVSTAEIPRSETAHIAGVRWERRRVTLLRVSIPSADALPSPATSRMLDDVVDKLQNFGGRLEEVSPRGVVAAFGLDPTEDAPRRAANAAIAIAKTASRDDPSGRGAGVALGIHATRALIATTGTASEIDRETKMQMWAVLDRLVAPGRRDIVVSDAAAALLRRHFALERLDATGDAMYRLAGREPGGVAAPRVSFIGRRPELDTLQSLLERARGGQGHVVSIVGEPGIGKSRLLHELRRLVADEFVVLEGRCVSYGTHVPYLPVLDVLQAVCGIHEADSPDRVDTKVRTVLDRLGPAASASAPYVQHLLHPRRSAQTAGDTPATVKARTFDVLRWLVAAQQAQQPLLLVFEDLQWIDSTSEELLATLAESAVNARVVFVTTFRPGYRPPWGDRPYVSQIALGPLSAAEGRRLVGSVLGDGPPEVVETILTRAEGNPFFLEELARAVSEHGSSPVKVPDTVHDVLGARIDRLPHADRQILRTAAVIGRDVPVGTLAEVSGVPLATLGAILGRLQTGEFLYATRGEPEPEYVFKHALTFDVAYEGLLEGDRRALHARVADAIEKLAPETRERRPETLARHYTEAGRHHEAIPYWQRAGQLAMQRSAHTDALAHHAQALTLLERLSDDASRVDQELAVQLAVATSLTATRGYAAPELERTLVRIRALTDRLDDAERQFSVRWTLWRFHISRADLRIAEELAGQLLAIASDQRDAVARVGAGVAGGVTDFYAGDFMGAREHLADAAAAYDPAQVAAQTARYGQDLGVVAWGYLGWTEAILGDLESGVYRARHALQIARDGRHPLTFAFAILTACETHELLRDAVTVRRLGDELLDLAREHSFTFFSAIGLIHTGWARAALGDAEGGIAAMREGGELFRSVGQRVGLAHRARLAEALIAAGSIDDGLDLIAEILRESQDTDQQGFVSEILRLKGEALSRRGDVVHAERCIREALGVATRQGAWLFALRAASRLVAFDRTALPTLQTIVQRFPASLGSSDLRAARALLEAGR